MYIDESIPIPASTPDYLLGIYQEKKLTQENVRRLFI